MGDFHPPKSGTSLKCDHVFLVPLSNTKIWGHVRNVAALVLSNWLSYTLTNKGPGTCRVCESDKISGFPFSFTSDIYKRYSIFLNATNTTGIFKVAHNLQPVQETVIQSFPAVLSVVTTIRVTPVGLTRLFGQQRLRRTTITHRYQTWARSPLWYQRVKTKSNIRHR